MIWWFLYGIGDEWIVFGIDWWRYTCIRSWRVNISSIARVKTNQFKCVTSTYQHVRIVKRICNRNKKYVGHVLVMKLHFWRLNIQDTIMISMQAVIDICRMWTSTMLFVTTPYEASITSYGISTRYDNCSSSLSIDHAGMLVSAGGPASDGTTTLRPPLLPFIFWLKVGG